MPTAPADKKPIAPPDPSGPQVVLREGGTGRWLRFAGPSRLLIARHAQEVLPLLRQVDEAGRQGLYAAGFISYEAAPALDPALPGHTDAAFPLLWFGLFPKPTPIKSLPLPSPGDLPALHWEPSIAPADYGRCLRSIRNYIHQGDTYQVNFTYRLTTKFCGQPWNFFLRLMREAEAPFAAYIDTGEWAVCSASPELFFQLEGNRIESRPMKGTAARGRWSADDRQRAAALQASEKDRAENVMIVDMVRNDLGRVAQAGSVQVPALFTPEQYPTLWHLTSTVSGRTTAPLSRIFQALFPPASVTGAPKRRTMEIIRELEPSPRRIYTGAIGFAAPGRRAQFNVAIRTVLINQVTHQAEYGVGSGIVWDSQETAEKEECRVKTRVLHDWKPAFELLETLRWSPVRGYALLEYHLQRLAESAVYFGFRLHLDRIRQELDRVARRLPRFPHRLRLRVTRHGCCHIDPFPLASDGQAFPVIAVARSPIDSTCVFLYHKTTQRQIYQDALEARPGFADVLLYNESGQITESTIANVAVEIEGALCTPPVSCGLLPGTYRAWMLAHHWLRERIIRLDELRASPRVYLMNSVRGIQRATLFDTPFSESEIKGLEFSPSRRKQPAGRRRSPRDGIVPD